MSCFLVDVISNTYLNDLIIMEFSFGCVVILKHFFVGQTICVLSIGSFSLGVESPATSFISLR